MKKIDWKTLILTCLVCLLPMIFGIFLYDKLPEQMPVHFNINNEVDRYATKEFAIFGLSGIMILLQIFCCVISDVKENKNDKKPKLIVIAKWIIPILTIVVSFITFEISLGKSIDVRKCIMIVLGIIYIIMGNYFPKVGYSQMKGKMHPMPKNEQSYRKMSRTLGYTFVIFGILMIFSVILRPIFSGFIVILMISTIIFEILHFC